MRKIITYLLLSYGITTANFAQQDSTLLLLDKTEINSDVLYPYLANDSTASWLKLGGDTNSISNSKRWKQLYAEYVYYNLESHLLPSLDSIIKQAEYEINYNMCSRRNSIYQQHFWWSSTFYLFLELWKWIDILTLKPTNYGC